MSKDKTLLENLGIKYDKHKLGTIIDGIGASEHIDSSGEMLSIEGMDISSLGSDDSIFNWEHNSKDNPSQVVGKITFGKKIFKKEDCGSDREEYYWKKSGKPFVYVKGELFDHPDIGHKGATEVASLLRYQNKNKGEAARNLLSFSIEGGKLEKQGMKVVKSLARDVAITQKFCNKQCILEILEDVKDRDDLYKTEIEENDLKKADYFAGLYQAKTGKANFKQTRIPQKLNPGSQDIGQKTGNPWQPKKTTPSNLAGPTQAVGERISYQGKPKPLTGHKLYNDPNTFKTNIKDHASVMADKIEPQSTGFDGKKGIDLYSNPSTFKADPARSSKPITSSGIKTSSVGKTGKELYSNTDTFKDTQTGVVDKKGSRPDINSATGKPLTPNTWKKNNIRKALVAAANPLSPEYLMGAKKLKKGEEDFNPTHPLSSYPHFIFTPENPKVKTEHTSSRDELIPQLRSAGFMAHPIDGKYGMKEKSILILNPPEKSVPDLHKMAAHFGQESSIESDGKNHKMVFHHGDQAGKVVSGSGTDFHEHEPEDFYSTLPDGTMFTHNFNFDDTSDKLKKSQTLVHYSPNKLTSVDPNKQGFGVDRKRPKSWKESWFYKEGVEPEQVVAERSKFKHKSSLGDKKLYDLAKDPTGIIGQLHEKAKTKEINPGIVHTEDKIHAIKGAGYHGYFNSNHEDPTMRNAVALFEALPVEESREISPEDRKSTNWNISKREQEIEKELEHFLGKRN